MKFTACRKKKKKKNPDSRKCLNISSFAERSNHKFYIAYIPKPHFLYKKNPIFHSCIVQATLNLPKDFKAKWSQLASLHDGMG